MRLVHHQQRLKPLGYLHQRSERREVAIHREDRLGHNHRKLLAPVLGKERLERRHIAMRVDMLAGTAEPNAIDDARMVERIGEDRVALLQQRPEQPRIGRVTRREEQRRLLARPGRQTALQRLVGG